VAWPGGWPEGLDGDGRKPWLDRNENKVGNNWGERVIRSERKRETKKREKERREREEREWVGFCWIGSCRARVPGGPVRVRFGSLELVPV
jgi:hypothetical protein